MVKNEKLGMKGVQIALFYSIFYLKWVNYSISTYCWSISGSYETFPVRYEGDYGVERHQRPERRQVVRGDRVDGVQSDVDRRRHVDRRQVVEAGHVEVQEGEIGHGKQRRIESDRQDEN